MTGQTNALAQGAIMAALAAVMGLVGIYLPVLGIVTNILWPIPLIVFIVRHNLRLGIVALLVALMLMGILSEPLGTFFLGLRYGGTALVFGYLIKRKASPGATVLSGGLVTVTGTALTIILSFMLIGGSLGGWEQELNRTVDQALEFYRNAGLMDNILQKGMTEGELRETLIKTVGWLVSLLPGALMVGSLAAAGINYLLTRKVLGRLGYAAEKIPSFRDWQLPWYVVWGVIAGLGLVLAGDYWEFYWVNTVGQNILYVIFPLLFLNGLSVVTFFYHRFSLSLVFKFILLFLVLINLPLTIITLALLGTFDPLFNYRKLTLRSERRE